MTETQALGLAFAFGLCYNWLFNKWSKSKYHNGLIAAWVIVGVIITLAISTFAKIEPLRLHFYWLGEQLTLTNNQHAAIFELKFFIATGIPMFLGSLWRYLHTKII